MTRKSPRELERALEHLDGATTGSSGKPFAERHYPPAVREYVYRLTRDVMGARREPIPGNISAPARLRRLLDTLREQYGIDADRDDAVIATLQEQASREGSAHWGASGVLMAAPVYGPALLDEADRARFDELRAAGRQDEADALLIRTVYHWLADEADARRMEGSP